MSATMRPLPVTLLALLAACTLARTDSDDLARRQQCDREAAASFKAMHPHGVSNETVDVAILNSESTYSTHWAAASQRCFMIVNEDTSTAFVDRDTIGRSERTLYEIGNELPLAILITRGPWPAANLDSCRVLERRCSSRDEWQRWVIAVWDR